MLPHRARGDDTVRVDAQRGCVNDAGLAVCGECLDGFVDYGTGDCRDADPCAADTVCIAEFRECVNDLGTAVCGDCVEGYMDDGGVCVIACGPVRFPGALVPFDRAANSSPSVETFVIGIGSELSVLNQLAAAGGTQKAYLIGANPSQEFADAFADIRAHGYCHYQIPTPVVSGGDYALVGVDLVDTSNPSISTTIVPVADAASCDLATGGWYYDDPVTPTEILLCPVSCDDFKAGGVDVDVILNCP